MVACAALGFALVAATILHFFYNYSRLRSVPGPLLAVCLDTRRADAQQSPGYGAWLVELHQRYGDIVRLGPAVVSLRDPEDIGQIYRGQNSNEMFQDQLPGQQDVAQFEDAMEGHIHSLVRTIRQYRTVNMSLIFHSIGEELRSSFLSSDYRSLLENESVDLKDRALPSSSFFTTIEDFLLRSPASTLKRDRLSCYGLSSGISAPARVNNPDLRIVAGEYHDSNCEAYCSSATISSIELISETLVLVFQYLLNDPRVLRRLRRELDNMPQFWDRASFPQARDLTGVAYLDALLNETSRLALLRSGSREVRLNADQTIKSTFLPRGTVVSWHPYVLQKNLSAFEDDIEVFRPERWIEADFRQRDSMRKSLLPMTACIDQSPKLESAWVQLKRLVVVLLREFDDIRPSREHDNDSIVGAYDPSGLLSTIAEFRSRAPTGRSYVGQLV